MIKANHEDDNCPEKVIDESFQDPHAKQTDHLKPWLTPQLPEWLPVLL